MIKIESLSFRRGDRIIFDGVNIDIPRGKVTAIMGPSGTGKTTLLKLISAQLSPTQGRVFVDGQDMHLLPRKSLFAMRKRMGMLFQSGALLTDLSVFDNIALPLREHTQLSETAIRQLVLMKLEAVGLRGAIDLMPSELSGGMGRRVALARAVALDPQMIFYDEPFAGQDPITMGVLVRLIRTLNDAMGLTSVVVTHDVDEVLSIADYAVVLSEGRVVSAGSAEALRQSSDPWVQQFIRGEADGPVPFHYPAGDYQAQLLGVSQ
ncbi:MAG: ATP-binding cassette domain-containing protein [Thiotrichales bacterium]|jgi:phospholipid/cholesterol/gamma-HCH transport system ATP-binding protein|nr:ATP-binding cassette domain-containing protein [Thiotrichales bacterium]